MTTLISEWKGSCWLTEQNKRAGLRKLTKEHVLVIFRRPADSRRLCGRLLSDGMNCFEHLFLKGARVTTPRRLLKNKNSKDCASSPARIFYVLSEPESAKKQKKPIILLGSSTWDEQRSLDELALRPNKKLKLIGLLVVASAVPKFFFSHSYTQKKMGKILPSACGAIYKKKLLLLLLLLL